MLINIYVIQINVNLFARKNMNLTSGHFVGLPYRLCWRRFQLADGNSADECRPADLRAGGLHRCGSGFGSAKVAVHLGLLPKPGSAGICTSPHILFRHKQSPMSHMVLPCSPAISLNGGSSPSQAVELLKEKTPHKIKNASLAGILSSAAIFSELPQICTYDYGSCNTAINTIFVHSFYQIFCFHCVSKMSQCSCNEFSDPVSHQIGIVGICLCIWKAERGGGKNA